MKVEITLGDVEAWTTTHRRYPVYAATTNAFSYQSVVDIPFGASDEDVKQAAIQAIKDALDFHNDPYTETDTFIVRGYQS